LIRLKSSKMFSSCCASAPLIRNLFSLFVDMRIFCVES
jgi:hypothetical protein